MGCETEGIHTDWALESDDGIECYVDDVPSKAPQVGE